MKTALKSSIELNGEGEVERTASPLIPALSPLRGEGVATDEYRVLEDCLRAHARSSGGLTLDLERGVHSASLQEHSTVRSAVNDILHIKTAVRAPSPLNGERAGVRGESFKKRSTPAELPTISPLLLRWFTWYCRGYIRRHFHSLRISINGLPPDTAGLPTVLFTNHASWWDPLVGLVIKDEFFGGRRLYAPIDAKMLQRYRMFAKLGFFGVEQGTRRGAVQFLRTSQTILQYPNHILAVTPQSRFADVRERPLRFQSGLGHLAAKVKHAVFLPMAAEFVFWEERLPEILVRFGEPVLLNGSTRGGESSEALSARLERKLAATLDALSAEAQRRNPSDFRTILRGGAGQGGIYDLWRGLKAKLRGETFAKEHGNK